MALGSFQLYSVPSGQRYWVVRANGGQYLSHFRTGGVIAIGHLDELNLPSTSPGNFHPDTTALVLRLNSQLQPDERLSKSQLSALSSQIDTFTSEMKIGDLVVTPGLLPDVDRPNRK